MTLSQNDRLIRMATPLGKDPLIVLYRGHQIVRTLKVNGNITLDASANVTIRGAKVIINQVPCRSY